ncbi:MAG: hypothetical protein KDI74_05745 [Gammaproteobacteria bacterium]|nr:hypothetical protein [Gammaproteobacteria bacterium]
MNGEKFHLDLTGRPLEGYRADDVAVALARLLRIPQERARNLLRGKPSRIKRQFEKEKALHLMDKLIACGAQCEVTPSETGDDGGLGVEADIEFSEKLELEIEQPKTADEGKAATAGRTDAVRGEPDAEPVVPTAERAVPADNDDGDRSGQSAVAKAAVPEVGGASASIVGSRQRVVSIVGAVVVLVGFGVWATLNFMGGSKPGQQNQLPAERPAGEAVSKVVSESENTRRRLELMASSVKIWMIQYGAGFDPSQVTLDRMQQDLGISTEEMEDGWGTRLHYSAAAGSFTITSAGPDRTFGSGDDIQLEKPAR